MIALLYTLAAAAPASDLVSSLPGWDKPLPSPIYSGFLDLPGTQKHLHYLLVEAEPPLDKSKAPLVLWLNGGPGCSSLEGFFYEHGPLVVGDAHAPPNINFANDPSANANASGKLFRNPWSWSRAASVLYLEAPAGVGFSYSPIAKEERNGDNGTAADNLAALDQFFLKFPEYKQNPFYVRAAPTTKLPLPTPSIAFTRHPHPHVGLCAQVSGESYGGVYVPTLSQKIYEAGSSFGGNMSGYLVGNGVFDHAEAVPTHAAFAAGHGFLSTAFTKKVDAACGNYSKLSARCMLLLAEVNQFFVDTNGYDACTSAHLDPPTSDLCPVPPLLPSVVSCAHLDVGRSVCRNEPRSQTAHATNLAPSTHLSPHARGLCVCLKRRSAVSSSGSPQATRRRVGRSWNGRGRGRVRRCRVSTLCKGPTTSTCRLSRRRCMWTRHRTRGRFAAAWTTAMMGCTTR